MKIMTLRGPDQPGIGGRACRSEPILTTWDIRVSWDATQPSIVPTSVTAGHTAKTNLSQGGL